MSQSITTHKNEDTVGGNMSFGVRNPYLTYSDWGWELRPLRDRILFAYVKDNTFLLLTYFIKKTQKTPAREIERAKKRTVLKYLK